MSPEERDIADAVARKLIGERFITRDSCVFNAVTGAVVKSCMDAAEAAEVARRWNRIFDGIQTRLVNAGLPDYAGEIARNIQLP